MSWRRLQAESWFSVGGELTSEVGPEIHRLSASRVGNAMVGRVQAYDGDVGVVSVGITLKMPVHFFGDRDGAR